MKYLVYTVSDFSDYAEACIKYLYESIIYNNNRSNFDFCVVSNKNLKSNFDIIFDENDSNYIGWSKYTKKLPEGYDGYLYLDSDILFNEKIENMFGEHDNSVVCESHSMLSPWFMFALCTEEEKKEMSKINGFNAGTFSFKKKEVLMDINTVCDKIKNKNLNTIQQACTEQTCFNYWVFNCLKKKMIFNNLTKMVQLHVTERQYEKSIFHFCGFTGNMKDKCERMEKFIERYGKNGSRQDDIVAA